MPKPLLLALVAATLATVGASVNCTGATELSSTSATQWQATCSSDAALTTTFDPALLTTITTGKTASVELTPKTAPQPVQVQLPATFAKIGVLESTTVTQLDIQRSLLLKGRSKLALDAGAFGKMDGLKKLTLGGFNITLGDSEWVVPGSLNLISINRCGLGKFKVKVASGTLNLTRVDLSYSDLTELPDFLFTTRTFQWVNLMGIEFPPLRLSLRRYTRLVRLLTAAKVQMGVAADYTGECDGGEKKTLKTIKTFLLCVVKEAEDDNVVVTDDDDASANVSNIISSQTTVAPSPSTNSNTPASSTGTGSPTPAPTSGAATHPSALLATVTATVVLFSVLFASA